MSILHNPCLILRRLLNQASTGPVICLKQSLCPWHKAWG